jgi:hypothetical protein
MMRDQLAKAGLCFGTALALGCTEPERAPRAGGDEESGEYESSEGGEELVELELEEVLEHSTDYPNRLQRMGTSPELSETHADAASVQVWASPEVAETFLGIDPSNPSQAVSFQPGTTFVKEHFDAEGEMIGINVMFKGPAGYAPESGDWYWLQVRGDTVTHSGRVEFCMDCHAAAINSDFVVGFGKSQ